jgi:hypothetical protein
VLFKVFFVMFTTLIGSFISGGRSDTHSISLKDLLKYECFYLRPFNSFLNHLSLWFATI